MTTPVGLNLVWADAGGTTDPTDSKYQLGWVAEIPTFQHFNYVFQTLDKAKLCYAESDIYPWQDLIAYGLGARVRRGDRIFRCKLAHNDSAGANPQDPLLDTTNSYWISGEVFSGKSDAYASVLQKEGVKLDEVNTRVSTNLWEGNDLTITNKNAVIALNNTDVAHSNLLLANVRGMLVVVDVGNTIEPNDQDLMASANANAFNVYHEGNKPKVADIEGALEDAPANGLSHSRKDNNWVISLPADAPILDKEDGHAAIVGERVTMNNSVTAATAILPPNPTDGQWVEVGGTVAYSVNPVYVDGVLNNIMLGADKICELDEDGTVYRFWWHASSSRWKIRKVSIEGRV